ncbi:hypothetical protein M6B38_132085 [Iris pallida]|uniref:Uncharacterized protein n=1 Tax=Iris pallida TaxID=29817 RepID=A0AAX6FRG8_IRIPA|nr:hypothetical protein M6B38_132085 [Iris pallida]
MKPPNPTRNSRRRKGVREVEAMLTSKQDGSGRRYSERTTALIPGSRRRRGWRSPARRCSGPLDLAEEPDVWAKPEELRSWTTLETDLAASNSRLAGEIAAGSARLDPTLAWLDNSCGG